MNQILLEIQVWLTSKASADQERAAIIEGREPFLARLLLDDARQARQLSDKLNEYTV